MLGCRLYASGGGNYCYVYIPKDSLPRRITMKTISGSGAGNGHAYMSLQRTSYEVHLTPLPTIGNTMVFDLSSYVGTAGMWIHIRPSGSTDIELEITEWS